MKRPRAMMSKAVYTAAAAVSAAVCLSGLVASLSPSSPLFSGQRYRSPLVVPRSVTSVHSSRSAIANKGSHRNLSLKSSLKENGLPSYNQTLQDGGDASSPDSTENDSSDADSIDAVATASNKGSTTQQKIQQVLSSPELLDPSSILDATIGAAEDIAESAEGTTAYDAAKSKEEDLELTLKAIMNHIEDSSNQSNGVVDEDDGEDYDVVESSQQQQQKSGEEKLTTSSVATTTTKKQSTQTQTATTAALTPPSIPKILRYTVPAIGIWLCSPVLSMIDTAAVGVLSGTAQQAALNPAVSVTDYGALIVAFMYTATTNLIAAAVQEDKDENAPAESSPKTTTTLITSLKLALMVGSIFGVILGTSGKFLLKLLIGNDSLDPAVFSAALRYVRIRSLGMPAMVVIGTAQSACLGMQDVTSPLYVLAAAAIVNFLGDVIMVPQSGNLLGGAAGAAWATVASQYAAVLFFARWLTTSPADSSNANGGTLKGFKRFWKRQTKTVDEDTVVSNGDNTDVVDVTQGIMELTGTSKAGRSRRKEFRKFLSSSKLSKKIRRGSRSATSLAADTSNGANKINGVNGVQEQKQQSDKPKTRGFLSGNKKLTLRSYLSLSNLNRRKAKEFLPFFVPVTVTSIGRISGYIAMSHVASSTLGTVDMAAHQIIFAIFCCLTPFVDALSQVAQSFVPAVFEAKDRGQERANALKKTINNFRKVGVGFGAVLVGLVACIPLISRFFTTDPIVMEQVKGAIPGLGLFLLVHGIVCGGEGTLLGQKDLSFLRNMYAVFFFTVPAYMLRLKYRSLAGLQNVGIGTMWAAFSTYNLIRASIWHLRLAQLQGRTNKEATASEQKDSR